MKYTLAMAVLVLPAIALGGFLDTVRSLARSLVNLPPAAVNMATEKDLAAAVNGAVNAYKAKTGSVATFDRVTGMKSHKLKDGSIEYDFDVIMKGSTGQFQKVTLKSTTGNGKTTLRDNSQPEVLRMLVTLPPAAVDMAKEKDLAACVNGAVAAYKAKSGSAATFERVTGMKSHKLKDGSIEYDFEVIMKGSTGQYQKVVIKSTSKGTTHTLREHSQPEVLRMLVTLPPAAVDMAREKDLATAVNGAVAAYKAKSGSVATFERVTGMKSHKLKDGSIEYDFEVIMKGSTGQYQKVVIKSTTGNGKTTLREHSQPEVLRMLVNLPPAAVDMNKEKDLAAAVNGAVNAYKGKTGSTATFERVVGMKSHKLKDGSIEYDFDVIMKGSTGQYQKVTLKSTTKGTTHTYRDHTSPVTFQ